MNLLDNLLMILFFAIILSIPMFFTVRQSQREDEFFAECRKKCYPNPIVGRYDPPECVCDLTRVIR
jgi:hypothetical protein